MTANLIYSEITVGRLLRKLNLECVTAIELENKDRAKLAALLSKLVTDAMVFSELENEH